MPTTIEWLTQHSAAGAMRILAGAGGKDNRIASVNIMDNPDTVQWLKPDELILTTGYLFLDDKRLRERIVAELSGRGCAGMGFVLGRYFDEPPPEMLRQADQLGFPVFSIPYEASLAEIGWRVYQRIFEEGMSETERLAAMQRRFSEGALREQGVGGMIADVVAATGCPVLVLDEELGLVGYDAAGFSGMGKVFQLNEGAQVFSRHVARSIAETARKQRPAHLRQTMPHDGDILELVVFPIYDEANVLGYLCLAETGKQLDPADHQFVQSALPMLAIQLIRRMIHGRARIDTRQEFLRFVMSPNPRTPAELKAQCELYGFDYRRRRVCVLLRLGDFNNRNQKQRKALSEIAYTVAGELLGKAHPDHFILPFQDSLILFLFFRDEAADADADVPALAERHAGAIAGHLSRMEIPALSGISKCYNGAETIRLCLDQALEAVRLGRELDPGEGIYQYRRYQFPHILAEALTHRQARELHGETMGRLEKHDRETGQELAAAMRAFIDNRLNLGAAAEKLSLHRNTLTSRLEKIREVLGRDPRDMQVCLEVVAGMHAGRLLAAGLLERDYQ